MTEPRPWTIDDAIEAYNVRRWGADAFTINDVGHLCVTPYGSGGPVIDIMDVLEDIDDKGLGFPAVIRFQDVLRSRVEKLNIGFAESIKANSYGGQYFGVFPIKVNQMREVVEEILDAGRPFHHGLEAGSKPELVVALALNDDVEALTICNGYKDEEYMRLALAGRRLGRKVVVVIEKLSELPLLLRMADEMQIEPMIGLRAKLTTKGAGKWEKSSGEFAKFGLSSVEIVQAVHLLRERDLIHTLRLFHFHVGSQLTDIHTIKDAVKEGARIYSKLRQMDVPLQYFDIGGGLGVDYEGTATTNHSSTNYSLDEYTSDVVYSLKQICDAENVPHPDIVTESGRALTAHHSCIVMNVFGSIELGDPRARLPTPTPPAGSIGERMLREMRDIVEHVKAGNAIEAFHDATAKKEEAEDAFRLGVLGLEERATIEHQYWEVTRRLGPLIDKMDHVPEDLEHLTTDAADQYLANFSLFQSALDHWAFDQLFPIMPLHRLDEEPEREATLVDITCDSDGQIDAFVGEDGERSTLRVHALRPDEPYFVGMFLTGAYQDIMGDMHNLFGRTHEVHVFVDDEDPEDYYLETVMPGDSIKDVLSRVQYEPGELLKLVKNAVDQRVKTGDMKPKTGVATFDIVTAAMGAYTYLQPMEPEENRPVERGRIDAMRRAKKSTDN